ncbi:hypothetical protein C6B37_00925, partial [Candidatus Phytoplasma phoenicium]
MSKIIKKPSDLVKTGCILNIKASCFIIFFITLGIIFLLVPSTILNLKDMLFILLIQKITIENYLFVEILQKF